MPAPSRRATMPTARRIATPRNSARMATSPPVVVVPVSKAGSSTWSVAQPSTQASATVSAPKSTLPSVESVKTQGSRRMATPRTRNPASRVESVWASARLTGSEPHQRWSHNARNPRCAPRHSAHRISPRGRRDPRIAHGADVAHRACRPVQHRPRGRRGRPHAVRGLDGQGPGHPPARPRARPARRPRHPDPPARRAHRPLGDAQAGEPGLHLAGRAGPQRAARSGHRWRCRRSTGC